MLRHMVLLRWAPTVEPTAAAAVLGDLQQLVRSMPGARTAHAVVGLGLAPDAFDAALIADFNDEASWRAYQDDPRHQQFVSDQLRPLLAERAATQVELPDAE